MTTTLTGIADSYTTSRDSTLYQATEQLIGQALQAKAAGDLSWARMTVPAMRAQALAKGREIGRSLYAKRLAAQLAQMTKGEIWRTAYVRGYNACRQRLRRGMAA